MHDPKRLVAQGYDRIAERYTAWTQRVRAEERARYTHLLEESGEEAAANDPLS